MSNVVNINNLIGELNTEADNYPEPGAYLVKLLRNAAQYLDADRYNAQDRYRAHMLGKTLPDYPRE